MARFAKREYQLELVTPAFLGGADQSAQWRTAGIKALIRQWWRVAYVAQYGVNVNQMRQVEASIFGSVNEDTNNAGKAKLTIRLENWAIGNLQQMPTGGRTHHPEVGQKGMNINTFLYLGFGPLANAEQGVRLTKERALGTNQSNSLTLIGKDLNADNWSLIDDAMRYIALFGTVGGRSRNGWGSLQLKVNQQPLVSLNDLSNIPTKELATCLNQDWASAVSSIWKGTEQPSWEAAINELARIKIQFRTHLGFDTGKNAAQPEGRHYIAYPVTNHTVASWGIKKRLPNSLRFKVFKTAQNRYVPIAFHLPHQLPSEFRQGPDNQTLENVWQRVYAQLNNEMQRI